MLFYKMIRFGEAAQFSIQSSEETHLFYLFFPALIFPCNHHPFFLDIGFSLILIQRQSRGERHAVAGDAE